MSFSNGSIDFTDRKILLALLAKGRSTFAELASQVGLTAPTVHDRVKKLERSGVIEGYTAIVNPGSLGYDITAIVSISVEPNVAVPDYVDRLSQISEIQKCFSVAGADDYMAIVLTRSPKTLERVLQRMRSLPGTRSTKASIVMSNPINRHSLPREDDVREFHPEAAPATVASSSH